MLRLLANINMLFFKRVPNLCYWMLVLWGLAAPREILQYNGQHRDQIVACTPSFLTQVSLKSLHIALKTVHSSEEGDKQTCL